MIETITTVFVPSIALNYEGNTLESVGIGGELFLRNTPLSSENTRLKTENAKLRELLHDARSELKKAEDELGRDLMNSATVLLGIRMRELGIDVNHE